MFWIIFILGIIFRTLWIIFIDTQPISDFLSFHNGAISIINGLGFRVFGYITAYEPIGYPAFLSLIYIMFGKSIIVAKVANVILSSITLLLVYFLVKKVYSKNAAIISMIFMAFYPRNITYCSVLSTEILFTMLFVVLMVILFKKKQNFLNSMIIGILLGFLSLIKPYMMVYNLIIFVLMVFETKKLYLNIKQFIIITVFMMITISPWTIRNYIVFNEFIPISTNGGYNLFINNNKYANGGWQDPFKFPNSPILKYKHKEDKFWDEVAVDKVGKRLAFEWIVENPKEFFIVGLKKLKRTFIDFDDLYWSITFPDFENKLYLKLHKLLFIFHIGTFLIVLSYLIKRIYLIKDRKLSFENKFILINILFFISIVFVFEGQPRYAFVIFPIFSLMLANLCSK